MTDEEQKAPEEPEDPEEKKPEFRTRSDRRADQVQRLVGKLGDMVTGGDDDEEGWLDSILNNHRVKAFVGSGFLGVGRQLVQEAEVEQERRLQLIREGKASPDNGGSLMQFAGSIVGAITGGGEEQEKQVQDPEVQDGEDDGGFTIPIGGEEKKKPKEETEDG